jgi:hypothetical protein
LAAKSILNTGKSKPETKSPPPCPPSRRAILSAVASLAKVEALATAEVLAATDAPPGRDVTSVKADGKIKKAQSD